MQFSHVRMCRFNKLGCWLANGCIFAFILFGIVWQKRTTPTARCSFFPKTRAKIKERKIWQRFFPNVHIFYPSLIFNFKWRTNATFLVIFLRVPKLPKYFGGEGRMEVWKVDLKMKGVLDFDIVFAIKHHHPSHNFYSAVVFLQLQSGLCAEGSCMKVSDGGIVVSLAEPGRSHQQIWGGWSRSQSAPHPPGPFP